MAGIKMGDVFGRETEQCDNVIILDNHEDYERHLLNSGYESEIVEAIGNHEGNPDYKRNICNGMLVLKTIILITRSCPAR